MITKITDNNIEFYDQLFDEVTNILQNFVDTYISSVNIQGSNQAFTNLDLVEKGSEVTNVTVNSAIKDSYTYQLMGEEITLSVTSNDFKDFAKRICQSYIDVGKGEVTELEDYFGIIKTISDCIDSNYQILPLIVNDDGKLTTDEDLFEIDANTRTIKIPTANYTYAVNGDNIAETIYFSIDRYFDAVDLNTKNIAILSEMNGEKCFTEILLRDVTTLPNKIIFGWPIGKCITANSGVLEFSVRFYSLGDGEKINYSLSTLTSKLNIKKGLDFLENSENVIVDNAAQDMLNLLENAEILGTGAIHAPIFHLDEESEDRIVNLDNNNKKVLSAAAHSLDNLEIDYYWVSATNSENLADAQFETVNDSVNTYILVPELTEDICKKYSTFYKALKPNGTPDMEAIISGIKDTDTVIISSLDSEEYKPSTYFYFRKGTQMTATSAGYYQCVAKNSKSSRVKITRTDLITIPYPADIEFKNEDIAANKQYIYSFDKAGDTATSSDVINKIKSIISYKDIPAERKGDVVYSLMKDTSTADNEYDYNLVVSNTLNRKEKTSSFPKSIILYPALEEPDTLTSGTVTVDSSSGVVSFKFNNYNDAYMTGTITIYGPTGTKPQVLTIGTDGSATYTNGTRGYDHEYTVNYVARYNTLLDDDKKSTTATGNFMVPRA